jgi:DNA helicase II / ATP-dependent DNA helicase PcrA
MGAITDGLTPAQIEAVTLPPGPVLLIGGAGTGKTSVLIRRFAWLVTQGASADSVLALGSSPRTVEAMRAGVEEWVEPPYEELHVDTFHSFCASLLREEALEAGLDPSFSLATPADRLALLLDHLDELTLRRHEIHGNPAPLLAELVSRIDRLKQEMIAPEALLAHAESERAEAHEGDDAARTRATRECEFAALYLEHERLLEERGALDFGDLVGRAFRLLHEKPHVRERVAARAANVLVDDYQDVNLSQVMLLGLLCEEDGRVTVACDDDQATHRPRGAADKNQLDFRQAFPGAVEVRLVNSLRSRERILQAARAVVSPLPDRIDKPLQGRRGGSVRFWRCASERAQAQAVAAEIERLIAAGSAPGGIAVLVRSVEEEITVAAAALEERAVPFRIGGPAAYFQRAEVRDMLAWLRLLADPHDSGAAVRALSRPPVELHSVDVARLTQLARRRRLDMPSAVAAALEGPQLTPEGRDRAQAFLRLYRSAAAAFEDRRPDAFVLRLIERIGIRRQQVFATQADTVERLRNIAKLPELATAYMRREPHATPRDFTGYLKAVADSGLAVEEAGPPPGAPAVRVMAMEGVAGLEFERVFVLGLAAARMPGHPPAQDPVPEALRKEELPGVCHEATMRRVLHVAMTRAREGLVLAFSEDADGAPTRPSPFYEEARAALGAEEERFEEELFGPAEGLHSTFRVMRDELFDSVARVAGRLGEMRLDTAVDVSHAVARYLELIKVAALIDRAKAGEDLEEGIREVNGLLAMSATPEQREILEGSALDDWLRDAGRDPEHRPAAGGEGPEPSLDPFIPRRREGLMLSASDIETYRICPLKYKFARVFRIPQEPTIHQRFGIVLHQVLERFHQYTGGSREELMDLFESSWRRGGFGHSDDELQFRERALDALDRYWEDARADDSEPVWFERSFSFRLGPHLLRGRVDRVDRHPDGSYELIDYKTGKARTEEQLREDVQLSVYQMGARESWRLETTAQSYLYVMTGERVPVEHSEEQLARVRETVEGIGEGILRQDFRPTPSREICSLCDYRIICPAAER